MGEKGSSCDLGAVSPRLNATRMPKTWVFLCKKVVENASPSPSIAPEQGSTLCEAEVDPCLVAEEICSVVFNNFYCSKRKVLFIEPNGNDLQSTVKSKNDVAVRCSRHWRGLGCGRL